LPVAGLPNLPAGKKLAPEDSPTRDFFYKPPDAVAADFIPLYANGEFQLFFLLDWRDRDKHGEGTPWYRISTKDFVHFTEHGEMLPRGAINEQDLYVFTGSAIQANKQYHIFYTGHNPYFSDKGKPQQAVMHAVSDDMQTWRKIAEHTFYAPEDTYEKNDWRDPFVFRNDETGEYYMLTAARFKKGVQRRRGLTALSISKDLIHWQPAGAFYAPDLYFTHECPDLFRMGDWYYLIFSEFSDEVRTRYRMSRSIKGPWSTPAHDDFDGHAFYAAKTASDGNNRYLFGWNPTRSGAKDEGGWEWGGNLVVHKLIQQANGELNVCAPDTVRSAFDKDSKVTWLHTTGHVNTEANKTIIQAKGSFGAAITEKMPETCRIRATVNFTKDTKKCGLLIRCDNECNNSYYLQLEPAWHRLSFDMWPRERSETSQMVELSRHIQLVPGKPYTFELFMDGNKGVLYLNDQVAMNFRAYNLKEGAFGIFATEGSVEFSNISLAKNH